MSVSISQLLVRFAVPAAQCAAWTRALGQSILFVFALLQGYIQMAKRVRSLASVLWDDDEDADTLLMDWNKADRSLMVRSQAMLVSEASDEVPERPDVHPVLKLDLVVDKPGLLKLRRTRDPWYWLQQLSQEVKGLPRLQQEVIQDLEQSHFANGKIVFDLPTSSLASSILSHAELCIRSISSKHPALYKIGVTRNPVARWLHTGYGYKVDRKVSWERMTVLHVHSNADVVCLLEAALIRIFFNSSGC